MEGLTYKVAVFEDYEDFYKIKCDPENVKWSGFASAPNYDKMKNWFYQQIKEKKRSIYLAYWNGDVCGFFYLDKLLYKDTEEIGYGVMTNFTGRGIGTALVEIGIKLCKASELIAWVSENNRASERCFEKNGFLKLLIKEQRMMSYFTEPHAFYCWRRYTK